MSSDRKSSAIDFANFGVNLYQTRKISNLQREMEDMGASLSLQVHSLQMAQEAEAARKALIVQCRKLVLDIEDEIGTLSGLLQSYPAKTSIVYDLMASMLEESALGPDVFEEFVDIERYRSMMSEFIEFGNQIESHLTEEDRVTKTTMVAYANDEENLSKAIEVAKKAEKAAKDLAESTEAQESSEPEWEELKRLDGIKRAGVRKTALASIFAGIAVAGAITVLGASGLALTPEQSEASSPYALYISWGIALISYASMSANPIIPSDHPLKVLRDSLPEKRRKAERLDADLSDLVTQYDVRTSVELEALEATRLAFVEKHSPMMDGVAP